MIYLLDTNTCIKYLNGRSESIRQKLESKLPQDILMCSVVKGELFFGAYKSANPEKNLAKARTFVDYFESFPFDDEAADAYGRIRAELEKAGTPIGPNDLLIAATAIANNAILVTNNTKEFARVANLKWEDWEE